MKIVAAWAGLWNMMFQYALVDVLRNKNIRYVLFVSEADELELIFPSCNPYESVNGIYKFYNKFLGKLRKFKFNRKHLFPYRFLLFTYKRYREITPYIYMYLMSLCKHNILANSSFVFFDAYLNQNPNKILIVPKVWIASLSKDEIALDDWIFL